MLSLLLIPSAVKAAWWDVSSWGLGLDSIGNAVQAVYMFFYDVSFVVTATILFLLFFAIELGLVYLYWRVGAAVYNAVVPAIKKVQETLSE